MRNTTKIILLSLTYVALSSSIVFSERGRFDKLSEKLNLTEEQETELRSLFEVAHQDCSEMERGPEHKECIKSTLDNGGLSNILDSEQLSLFEEMGEKKGERKGQRERGGRSRSF